MIGPVYVNDLSISQPLTAGKCDQESNKASGKTTLDLDNVVLQ